MPIPAAMLTEWLSPFVVRRFAQDNRPVTSMEETHVSAAVLFVDVCGFTRLTDQLARQGPAGMERLAELINSGFGRLVERIHHWGGEIARFPGDAVLALWLAQDGDLDRATRLAAACGRELVSTPFGEVPPGVTLRQDPRPCIDPKNLHLRGGLAAGEVTMAHIGGILGRWEFLLMGTPFVQVGHATERSLPSELVVHPLAWAHIRDHASGAPRDRGYVLVESIQADTPTDRHARAVLDERSAPLVGGYVPRALLSRLEANPQDWLGEIRPVSAVFIKLHAKGTEFDLPVELLDRAVRLLQSTLYRFEGSVDKLNMDEKGLTVLAAMGLPPFSHENDPARAVAAAVAIRAALADLDIRCSIGVASGRVFCGPLGGEGRREYTMVGSVINLAARMMMDKDGGLLTDSNTAREASRNNPFTELSPRIYPGFEKQRRVFLPDPAWSTGRRIKLWRDEFENQPSARAALVGRAREISQFELLLDTLGPGGGGVVVLQGEAGIGKTALARRIVDITRRRGLRAVVTSSEEILQKSPYHAWQSALDDLLDIDAGTDRDLARTRVVKNLALIPDGPLLTPLLEAILPLGLADNETTALLSGAVRRDNLHELIVRVVRRACQESPLLLLIEDAHWMDPASWALLDAVHRGVQDLGIVVLLTMRPSPVPSSPEAERLLARSRRTELAPLTRDEVAELLLLRTEAKKVARDVVEFVVSRAQGNPLFCEELLNVLRETGMIELRNGHCHLASQASPAGALPLTDSVNGLILSRVDLLPPHLQLTLKTASVIGPEFDLRTLAAIHPVTQEQNTVRLQLDDLVERDLLRQSEDSLGEVYFFKHALTREVAYGSLLPSQRQALHRSIASRWEDPSRSGPRRPSILLDHWRQAGDFERAIPYADTVGTSALRQASYDEAITCFHWLLGVQKSLAGGASPQMDPTRARWLALLGEAEAAAGLHDAARQDLEAALQCYGRPIKTRGAGLLLSILVETLSQLGHRLRWGLSLPEKTLAEPSLGDAAIACEQLGFVYYAEMQTLQGVQAALKMLNLAEQRGPCPALARAYAATALTASVIPWQAAAQAYERLALSLIERLGDPLTAAHVHWVRAIRTVGIGDWTAAEQSCRVSMDASARYGDRRLLTSALQTLQSLTAFRGRVGESLALGERQIQLARDNGENSLWEAWARNGLGETLLTIGRFQKAEEESRRALALLTMGGVLDKGDQIRSEGILARALQALGRKDEALEHARSALALIESVELTAWSSLEGYMGVAEVLLVAASQGTSLAQDELKRAFKAADNFVRVFPIGRPRRLMLGARRARLERGPEAALPLLERAMEAADSMALRLERLSLLRELSENPAAADTRRLEASRERHAFLEGLADEIGTE